MLKCKHCGAKVSAKVIGNTASAFHFCEVKKEYVFHKAKMITDTDRLEWIFNHLAKAEQVITDYWCETYGDPEPKPIRDAIDAAIKAEKS